jgi:hypothetical protein
MTALERYLRTATRGLWGRKRLEVREELTAHVLERAYRHEVAGLGHEAAVARAIAELGNPQTIRAGMIGVHTMPNLFKISGTLTILAVGAVTMLNVSRAQIGVSERLPVQQCADLQVARFEFPFAASTKTISCNYGGWLSVEGIKKTLEPMGVKFSREARSGMRYPNATNSKPYLAKWNELVLDFPNWSQVRLVVENEIAYDEANGQELKIPLVGEYVHAGRIVEALRQAGGELRIAGWDNPGIRFGGVRFMLGTREKPVLGHRIFPELMLSSIFQLFPMQKIQAIWWKDAPNVFEEQSANSGGRVLFRGGIIEYPSRAKTLRFSSQLKDLKLTKNDQTGNVVILRFTGDLSRGKNVFEVMSAENFSK